MIEFKGSHFEREVICRAWSTSRIRSAIVSISSPSLSNRSRPRVAAMFTCLPDVPVEIGTDSAPTN
jgi:hypothetical protein